VYKIWRGYFGLFQGEKSLNSWAIEIFFNEEKGKKNEKNCTVYFKTFTRVKINIF